MSAITTGLLCFLLNLAGVATMLVFGASLGRHSRFLGFEGDLDAASRACYRTAVVFGVLAGLSLVALVLAALRQKRGYGSGGGGAAAAARGDYVAV